MFHQVFICTKPQEATPFCGQLRKIDNVKPDPENGVDETTNLRVDIENNGLSEIANSEEFKLGIKIEIPAESSQEQDMCSSKQQDMCSSKLTYDDVKVFKKKDILTIEEETGNFEVAEVKWRSSNLTRHLRDIYVNDCQISGFVESTLLQNKENTAALIEEHVKESILTNSVTEFVVPDSLSSNNNISASSDSESNNSTAVMSEGGDDSCSDWEQEYLLSRNHLKTKPKQHKQEKYCDILNTEQRAIKTAEIKNTTKERTFISATPVLNVNPIISRVQEIKTSLRTKVDSSSNLIVQKSITVAEDKVINKKVKKNNPKKNTEAKCSLPKIKEKKSENSDDPFMCIVCNKWFKNKRSFACHSKYSLCAGYKRQLKHQCDICGKLFYSPEKLQSHKNSHVNARPHKCFDCDKYFNSKTARLMHYKNMHQNIKVFHLCCYCGITSKNILDLLAHEEIHRLPEGAEIPTPFKCLRCGKGFISLYKLQRHKKEHSLKKCPHCSEEFIRDTQLRIHLEEVHNVVHIYTCNICKKTFKSRHTRNGHSKLHFKALSFFCDICDKGFKTKKHIEQHMISHSDERPIHCSECDETFKRKTHLKQHIASAHEGGSKRRSSAK